MARGVAQAKDVSVFYYTPLSQIKEHNFCLSSDEAMGEAQAENVSVFLLHSIVTNQRTLLNLQHLDQLL